jgi:CheY-like chemotaxis protein
MCTILVIDDNPSVRESLRFLFQRRGYEVLVADNGPTGVRLAAEHAIDGAMVDVQMPGMNGIEVCQKLREQAVASGREIAVWMMTGGRSPELTKLSGEAGALALLAKPFDLPDLFRRFEEKFGPVAPPASISDPGLDPIRVRLMAPSLNGRLTRAT